MFSPFDSKITFIMSISLIMSLILVYTLNTNLSISMMFKSELLLFLLKSFNSLKFMGFSQGLMFFSLILVFLVFCMNFFSIFPYIFSMSAQISMILTMSISLWGMSILFFSMNNINYSLSHLVPFGSPLILSWFLVLVEAVSMVIRPFTLTIRLMANIMAGHLCINLLYCLVEEYKYIFFSYMLLLTFELFISCVQSYIFVVLVIMYFSEVE